MRARAVPLLSRKGLFALALIAPSLATLVLFRYYPVASAVYHSFFRWDGWLTARYVGFDHFRELFTDGSMGAAAVNIARYIVGRVVLNCTFPLLGAALVFHLTEKRAAYAYRLLFMVPLVVPTMVVLLVWKFVYSPADGLLNRILMLLSLDGLTRVWLGDFRTALNAVIGLGFPWVTGIGISGFGLLIFLAGLQNIPEELFDAATVDGVRVARRLFGIELPLLANQIKLVVVLTTINTLQSYVPVMILTGGGPGTSSLVPGLYLYHNAFSYDRFGYACTIGIVMAVILTALTAAANRATNERERIR